MRARAALIASLAVALAASAAVAGPPPGKGKQPVSGAGCKPKVSLRLAGTLTSDPGAGATSFTMSVSGANKHGKNFVTDPATVVTIAVDAKTKVRRQGAKTVEALALNDRVNVRLGVCKGDLPLDAAELAAVPAARVVAHPAAA